jgi:hypothetical protein
MSCCGDRRKNFQAATPSRRPDSPATPTTTATRDRQFTICFEYIGRTGLTVIGGATGRQYRFDRPGSRVIVDPRDRPSLATVPHIRQV